MNAAHTRRILTCQCRYYTHSVDLYSALARLATTLCAANVFKSAWIPAPPEGSEPAIVRTGG